jgi:hypothetical protein
MKSVAQRMNSLARSFIPSLYCGFEGGDGGGFVEVGVVDFGGDGVGGYQLGQEWLEQADSAWAQPLSFVAGRQDDWHSFMVHLVRLRLS